MVELKGSLSGIGLPAVVQLIGDLHHSGTLHLVSGAETGLFAFDNGRLIAAHCGEISGLPAITACATELGNGEFTFVEGAPGTGALNLSHTDVARIVSRARAGQITEQANGVADATTGPSVQLACRLLGFADDRAHHYSRPTALHRCYASGTAGLVSAEEQRELCLSGRFATCPRYRTADTTEITPPPEVRIPTPHVAVAPRAPRPTRPPAVAPTSTQAAGGRRGRAVLLMVGGGVVGLVLVVGLLLIALPMLTQPSVPSVTLQTSATQAPVAAPGAVSSQPVAAPRSTAVPTATAVPTSVATPTALRPATPTALARPTAVPGGVALADVRFAAGPADNWVANPPYATWSDGAYRLNAKDATRFVAVGVPLDEVPSDVVVSGTFRKTGGPPGGGYGLFVRDQGDGQLDGVNQTFNAYVLEASDTGEYGIWRRDDDHWVDLVPWTASPAVRSGGSPNELSVRAIGDRLSFSVNGAEVASVQDATLPDGNVGIFVGGDYNEVALDEFTVELPQ